jgi:hypothetical protein
MNFIHIGGRLPSIDGADWVEVAVDDELGTAAYSATIRHGCLFVYSPNTPFDVTEPSNTYGYTRFRAHAVLNHGGNLSAAAQSVRRAITSA